MLGVDRAILEGETEGFVKIHVKAGTDTIVGATIVGSGAGNMISEISVAMQHGVGLGKLASVIHPYPTHGTISRFFHHPYCRDYQGRGLRLGLGFMVTLLLMSLLLIIFVQLNSIICLCSTRDDLPISIVLVESSLVSLMRE